MNKPFKAFRLLAKASTPLQLEKKSTCDPAIKRRKRRKTIVYGDENEHSKTNRQNTKTKEKVKAPLPTRHGVVFP